MTLESVRDQFETHRTVHSDLRITMVPPNASKYVMKWSRGGPFHRYGHGYAKSVEKSSSMRSRYAQIGLGPLLTLQVDAHRSQEHDPALEFIEI